MGNITGTPFDPNLKKQIDIRQLRLGKLNRENDDLLFYNSKTAWLRLASSVNVSKETLIHNIPLLDPASSYTEEKLARKCVLFGGMSSTDDKNITLRGGINTDINDINDINDILGIGSYGFGGSDNFGFRPMPGLIQANVNFLNRGALQKADITLKAYNITQLQIIDTLYLRIGYTMLLEYGWSIYFDEDNKLKAADALTEPFKNFFNLISKDASNQNHINDLIKQERKNRSYNYDAFLGKVVNYHWKFNSDGSYDITINLIGLGDIIEALKVNTSTGTGKVINLSSNIQNQINNERANYKKTTGQAEANSLAGNKTTEDYNKLVTELVDKPNALIIDTYTNRDTLQSYKNWEPTIWYKTPWVLAYLKARMPTPESIDLIDQLPESLKSNDNINKGFIQGVLNALPELTTISLYDVVYEEADQYRDHDKILSYFPNISKTTPQMDPNNPGDTYNKENKYYKPFLEQLKENIDSPYYGTLKIAGAYLDESRLKVMNEHLSRNNPGFNTSEDIKAGNLVEVDNINELITKLQPLLDSIPTPESKADDEFRSASALALHEQKIKELEDAKDIANTIGGQSVIKYANTTEMNKFIYYNIYLNDTNSLKEDTKNNPLLTGLDITIINDLCNNKTIKTINFHTKGQQVQSIDYNQHYIKLKALLKYIELKFLLYNPENDSKPLFDFDLDELYDQIQKSEKDKTPKIKDLTKNGLQQDSYTSYQLSSQTQCLSYEDQISANPSICYIDNEYKLSDNIGLPLNIWVNVNHISACIQQNIDREGKVTLLSFLQSLITGINNALGDINKMTFIYDGEVDNKVRLLEEIDVNNIEYEVDKLSRFVIYGLPEDKGILKGSFITDIDLTVQLPPNMASMATVSAQANGSIVGESATGLSKLNDGLTDRIIKERLDNISLTELTTIKNKIKKDISVLEFIKDLKKKKSTEEEKKYIDNFFTKGKKDTKIKDLKDEDKQKLISLLLNDPDILLAQHQKAFNQYKNEIYDNNILNSETVEAFMSVNRDLALQYITKDVKYLKINPPFFIPFNLSLTMDGLSGMVNYQRFKITDGILPDSFKYDNKTDKLNFLVKGISHSIQNNRWTTKIESMAIAAKPKPTI